MSTEPAADISLDPVVMALRDATLRHSADRVALERFLRAAPEFTSSALLHFSEFSEASPSEPLGALQQHGATPDQLVEFEQALISEEDDYLVARIAVDPPTAPHLRALWDAIDPDDSGLGCTVR